MKKLLGLMGLMGLMGFLPINPIMAQESDRVELRVETRQFFQDNEWFGLHGTGYTLPGFYMRPVVSYVTKTRGCVVNLEGGAHWLHFWGARHYPSAGSLGVWQEDSDTATAVHVLPWVRAEIGAEDGRWMVTMGSLREHDMPLPLYNPERQYAADPEAGVQLRLDYRHLETDLWVDWQEYIWQRSRRQERFTAGVSGAVKWQRGAWGVKVPVHVTGQHVGGQGLKEHKAVQNRFNGAVGLMAEWRREGRWRVAGGCYAMGFTHKNMPMIPYRRGWGLYPTVSFERETERWETAVDAGYWQGHGFVPLLGSVLFSNVGNVEGTTYFGMNRMVTAGARYRWRGVEAGSITVEGRWYHYFEKEKASQYTVGLFIELKPKVELWRR